MNDQQKSIRTRAPRLSAPHRTCGFIAVVMATAWVLSSSAADAQDAVQTNEIEKQLLDLYQTTKATADGTDIVTAGSVLVLQKDHLLMDSVASVVPPPIV